jgi:outer membrane protein assembly factor BamA
MFQIYCFHLKHFIIFAEIKTVILNSKTKRYSSIPLKLAALVFLVLLFACSPVKFVPENRYLLNKVEVEVDNSEINKEEARMQVRQKENYKILGFARFHLWLYNLSSKNKPGSWLKRIGEPPEIYDEALVGASQDRLKQYLDNKGFFRADVYSETNLNENKQKANVKYKIVTGEQYKIRKINYHISDSTLQSIFLRDSTRTFISEGTPFDFNLLEE